MSYRPCCDLILQIGSVVAGQPVFKPAAQQQQLNAADAHGYQLRLICSHDLPSCCLFPNSNYGFDPLGLCKNPEGLKRFTESEVIHCRWAMLGAAGCLGVEALGQGNWYDAPLWVSCKHTYGACRSASLVRAAQQLHRLDQIRDVAATSSWLYCIKQQCSVSEVNRSRVLVQACGVLLLVVLACVCLSCRPSTVAPPPGSASPCLLT